MAHYPTLTYSTFKVQANGLPAELRVLPPLDATLPPAYDFDLEEKVVKDYEDSQAAAEKLAAQEPSPVTATPSEVAESASSSSITDGVGDLSLDPEKKKKLSDMKELTKGDEKTCLHYLDSYSWDLERAVQEYFSK